MNFLSIILIKNGFVINPWVGSKADVLISDGKIDGIFENSSGSFDETHLNKIGAKIIDAAGCLVMPGCIDAHLHLGLPYRNEKAIDDFEIGSKAALSSGITSLIDYTVHEKGENLLKTIERRRKDADGNSYVDYALHCCISDFSDKIAKDFGKVIDYGINSFKLFMAYPRWLADDAMILKIMEEAVKYDAVVEVHAESYSAINHYLAKYDTPTMKKKLGIMALAMSRPDFTEAEAVSRLMFWAGETGCRVHVVHVSTAEAAYIIAEAKTKGIRVTAETCPQYLFISEEKLHGKNGHYNSCCPPLRQAHNCEGLWQALNSGVFDMVTTDSCAFNKRQKDLWNGDFTKIANGLYGIETLMPLIFNFVSNPEEYDELIHGMTESGCNCDNHNHKIKAAENVNLKKKSTITEKEKNIIKKLGLYQKIAGLLAYGPAKIFGMAHRKGHITAGNDADIIIIDPFKAEKINNKNMVVDCGYSPFNGLNASNGLLYTISGGKIAYASGKFIKNEKNGKFIERF